VARIAGVNLPTQKNLKTALTYIYGIGDVKAKEICEKASIDGGKRVRDLGDEELIKIRQIIDADYVVEGDLRKEVSQNIMALKSIKCYRGIRHIQNLPVNGQRTHTNARTRKGKAVAIAGKKMTTK